MTALVVFFVWFLIGIPVAILWGLLCKSLYKDNNMIEDTISNQDPLGCTTGKWLQLQRQIASEGERAPVETARQRKHREAFDRIYATAIEAGLIVTHVDNSLHIASDEPVDNTPTFLKPQAA